MLKFLPSVRSHLTGAVLVLGTLSVSTGALAVPEQAPAQPAAATPTPLMQQVRDRASEMVLTAMNFIGVPYRRGGTSAENGFDCSGFTRHLFEQSLGLLLPRRADEQARAPGLLSVRRDELKPGDLVFFNTMRRTFSHVGIYVGDGKFIHSPRVGSEVRIDDMHASYWSKRFTGARRSEAGNTDALQGAAESLRSTLSVRGADALSAR